CTLNLDDCIAHGFCGDNILDPNNEICDGVKLNDKTCEKLGYPGGTLSCSSECRFDISACIGGQNCGNGVIDQGEECDGQNLGSKECDTLGSFIGGDLTCGSDCLLNTSGCYVVSQCGDNTIQGSEECDGQNLNMKTCITLGFSGGGTLSCSDCEFNTTQCISLEECGVAGDEDGNGLTDCSDPQCDNIAGPQGFLCQQTETTCDDGFDNDADGLIDCSDPSCAGLSGGAGLCQTVEIACADGFDNDNDGFIDDQDSDCQSQGFAQQLYLWEVDPDADGVDTDAEFIELSNLSTNTIDFSLEKHFILFFKDENSTPTLYWTVQLEGQLAPSGLFLLGNGNMPGADQSNPSTLYNAGGCVLLVRCDDCSDTAEFSSLTWDADVVFSTSSGHSAEKIDALVYHDGVPHIQTFLDVCAVSSQWNEDENGAQSTESLHRVTPGAWSVGSPNPGSN
ncbi:hypothetical protein KJ865_04415, partial [Myxococcota bacterium]|nr:hypothetical protein [Myxococcota bacterium]